MSIGMMLSMMAQGMIKSFWIFAFTLILSLPLGIVVSFGRMSKNTSIAYVLSVQEMFTVAKAISASQASVSPLIIAAVFYYVFNFIVAFVMERIEKKMDYYR